MRREYLAASRQRGDVYVAGKTEEHEPGGVSLGLMATGRGPHLRHRRAGGRVTAEVRFHHLERRRLDEALPRLLERALEEGQRVLVRASSDEMVAALNERLWTYDDASFLPHGAAGDGDPMTQPIFLTSELGNPNAATMLVRLSGVEASRTTTCSTRRPPVRRARRGGAR